MKLTEDILRAQQLLKWGSELSIQDGTNENPDVLLIYAGLVTIEKAVQALKSEYQDSALKAAKEKLEKLGKDHGSLKHNTFVFNVSKTDIFDFVGNPQKYHDETGTQYREEYYQQAKYKSLAQACTKVMKGLGLEIPTSLSDDPKVVQINDL